MTAAIRQYFMDGLRLAAGLPGTPETERVLAAFGTVPREDFAGPGPWIVRAFASGQELAPQRTPDADPRWLYHPGLIALDAAQGINIGDPALWVRLLQRAEVPLGGRVLQVGAGTGYYTAILSHLVGPGGHVTAYEVSAALAARARAALAGYDTVDVHLGNATTDLESGEAFDLIVGFAGVSHVPAAWAAALAPGGRLLLPLTGETGWGAMILARPTDGGFDAVTLGACGFFPCTGARSAASAARVGALFHSGAHVSDARIRLRGAESGTIFDVVPGAPADG